MGGDGYQVSVTARVNRPVNLVAVAQLVVQSQEVLIPSLAKVAIACLSACPRTCMRLHPDPRSAARG